MNSNNKTAVAQWQLVPVEPTVAMLSAANKTARMDCTGAWIIDAAHAWGAMLSAAPSPTEQAKAGKVERCRYCDGTGDVHSLDGEWRGTCTECTAPTGGAQAGDALIEALKFYAEKNHFNLEAPDDWDDCSGEPRNFLFRDDSADMIEDGTVARVALENHPAATQETKNG